MQPDSRIPHFWFLVSPANAINNARSSLKKKKLLTLEGRGVWNYLQVYDGNKYIIIVLPALVFYFYLFIVTQERLHLQVFLILLIIYFIGLFWTPFWGLKSPFSSILNSKFSPLAAKPLNKSQTRVRTPCQCLKRLQAQTQRSCKEKFESFM